MGRIFLLIFRELVALEWSFCFLDMARPQTFGRKLVWTKKYTWRPWRFHSIYENVCLFLYLCMLTCPSSCMYVFVCTLMSVVASVYMCRIFYTHVCVCSYTCTCCICMQMHASMHIQVCWCLDGYAFRRAFIFA